MDKDNRKFFTALDTLQRPININHIILNDIIEAYDELARKYNDFIKKQENSPKANESKQLKRSFDKLFRYWIDPFNIALRNEIGAISNFKVEVKKVVTNQEGKAILTPKTIKEIRQKYSLDLEKETFIIHSKEEFIQVLKEVFKPTKTNEKETKLDKKNLVEKQKIEPYKIDSEISKRYKVKTTEELLDLVLNQLYIPTSEGQENREFETATVKLRKIQTYTFYTGMLNQLQSFVNKYEIALEYDRKICVKQIYGDIDIKKFYTDDIYKRIVLEAIENLEIENYRDRQNEKYIGTFIRMMQDGKIYWEQNLNKGEKDAVEKIERIDAKARQERIDRNNKGEVR